ncbi:C39 family peptidase [Aneurinibacillus terranovensis]|uniref:C39 family peptidase n=1 Tax=Aneurinibacillus terranovensis TaxID=278991 RepID=UPI000404989B|nr:C39 family peptidase [Aneurinibacillus terranovensis]
MKKIMYTWIIFLIMLFICFIAVAKFYPIVKAAFLSSGKNEVFVKNDNEPEDKKTFEVYYYNDFQGRFKTFEQAVSNAKKKQHSSVRKRGEDTALWNNYASYKVYQGRRFLGDFKSFAESVSYAKGHTNTTVYFKENQNPVWEKEEESRKKIVIDAPLLSQQPELPRGCEVTSLSMMLQFTGVKADKITLAKEVKKDLTVYQVRNGSIFFGNPYDGYVGNMYTFSEPGYGVYHGPIVDLAEKYLPNQIIDMTGAEFTDLFFSLKKGRPVWVIVNTTFDKLPENLFEKWETPSGPVNITYKEHSVLLTGYDGTYIYFNDPLANIKNRKIPIIMFKRAWEQMGKQAVTYIPK